MRPLVPLPKPRAPVNLDEALGAACRGVAITPEVFRSLLSPEDLDDIEAGAIHPKTLRAYARSFAEGMAARSFETSDPAGLTLADYDDPAQDDAYRRKTVSEPGYEPGAQAMYCCLEHDAGIPPCEAELESARLTATLATRPATDPVSNPALEGEA